MIDGVDSSARSYPRFPGDAIIPQREPSERTAPFEVSNPKVPPRSAKASKPLTNIDLLVCVVLPPVGVIAGILRCIRGDPTGWRMLSFSTLALASTAMLRACNTY